MYRFKSGTNKQWLQVFDGSDIPYGQVNNIPEVFQDPQVCFCVVASMVARLGTGIVCLCSNFRS